MSLSQRPVQDNTQPAPAPKPATAPAKLQNIKTKVGPRQVADELAPRRQLDTRGLVLVSRLYQKHEIFQVFAWFSKIPEIM